MAVKYKFQTILTGLTLLTVGILLVLTTSRERERVVIVKDCPNISIKHTHAPTTDTRNSTRIRQMQAAAAIKVDELGENVPAHVATVISQLYEELKSNGSIINDLITTQWPIIPNIYHYVRFNQSVMKFHEMLSIQSALKIGQADMVYIHTNMNPEGKYWNMMKEDPRIQVNHREAPTSIFGKPFGWVHHGSDLARIQILREYGGIYLDNDCVVINEFERLRKHHCVVSKSSEERHMGNMVMMATKDCVFMRLYEELYKLDYRIDEWYYNGGELPQYALLDKYPGIAFMADEGVQQRMLHTLWNTDTPVIELQKYWSIIHIFYGHKGYSYKDHTDYDEENIRQIENTFTRLARWILFDTEDPFIDNLNKF